MPVRTNGVEMPMIEMIESIETIAGTHGVGRVTGPGRVVRLNRPRRSCFTPPTPTWQRRQASIAPVALSA